MERNDQLCARNNGGEAVGTSLKATTDWKPCEFIAQADGPLRLLAPSCGLP